MTSAVSKLGDNGVVGAEDKPRSGKTEVRLTWLAEFRTALNARPHTTTNESIYI